MNNVVYLNEPLSKNFAEAKKQILTAIKQANINLINRKISQNIKFEFCVKNKDKKTFQGEVAQLGRYSKIVVKLPKKATLRLIHNGVLVYENETKILEFDNLDIGKYRVEVYYKNKT